ncbi:phosphatase PAP2 family protein [Paenibacillus sp. HW567]|uniref:phosphatase PAP2 family protein n=1 Tax=Paenibacillus sp. HW567 TaxID=1034769 RepID=UPI00037E5058|nr:phosphatase PAP2 family protein [Paenibacillus sp. HW567]
MAHLDKPSYKSVWLSLLWLLIIPLLNTFYGILNRAGDHVYNLEISLDHLIPFVPVFIIPYLIWYPFITGVLVALAFKNRKMYFQTLIALCSGLIASYLFFAVFQTAIQRPDVHNEIGVLYRLIELVYRTDQPYNCFPSIHVLTSYLMLRGAREFGKINRWLIAGMSVLIILSTVLVKQHLVVDIVGGILVGELCFRLSGVWMICLRRKQQFPGFHEPPASG